MLLTKTIEKTTTAIKARRASRESKHHADTYAKALDLLVQTTEAMKGTLACAAAVKEHGIVSSSLMDEATRSDLLACINDCGNGVSEMQLTMEKVKLLKSKGDAFNDHIKTVWRDAAQKYSDGPKGYLSIIGSLSNDPKRVRELATSISKTVSGVPSIKAINSLMSDIAEANQMTEQFSFNPEVEFFLKKVSSQYAMVSDLTPEVLAWLQEKELTSKLKIKF